MKYFYSKWRRGAGELSQNTPDEITPPEKKKKKRETERKQNSVVARAHQSEGSGQYIKRLNDSDLLWFLLTLGEF